MTNFPQALISSKEDAFKTASLISVNLGKTFLAKRRSPFCLKFANFAACSGDKSLNEVAVRKLGDEESWGEDDDWGEETGLGGVCLFGFQSF